MEKGVTIWLTGLSASGKTTLAKRTVELLKGNDKKTQLIDGDIMREEIGGMFGYSREERIKAAKVYRIMAKLLNDNGINVVVAAISPYEEIRRANRKRIENYIEIYVNCSLDVCKDRDPKGLYKRAIEGKEEYFVGVDEEFETPYDSNLEVNTCSESIEESFDKIKEYLKKINVI